MSDLLSVALPVFTTVLGAFLTHHFSRKDKDALSSEDIEEIIKPDGSRVKKHKKRYK